MKDKIKQYFTILNSEDINALFSMLDEDAVMITPFDGTITGRDAIQKNIVDLRAWLIDNNGKVTIQHMINIPDRLIIELDFLTVVDEKRVEVPVATVLDFHNDAVTHIRVYHSIWPITGRHRIIAPSLEPIEANIEINSIQAYLDALADADLSQILSLFEDEAYVQEAGGSLFRHQGIEKRKKYYTSVLSQGKIPLKICTVTVDGSYVVLEYIFDEWGAESVAPQAGLMGFKLGKSNKIAALRIYDDVLCFHSE